MGIVYKTLAGLGLWLLVSGSAQASFRCNSSLVSRGLTFIEVLERCGAPELEYQRLAYAVRGVLVIQDEWVYEQGPNRFRRQLTFENGRLVRIETRPKPRRSLRSLESLDDARSYDR